MFCSECGQPVHGKFCSHCGAKLTDESAQTPAVIDLDHEVRYESILKYPGVREKIAASVRQAPLRLSGEQVLGMAEKLSPVPVPLVKIAGIIQPLYARWGIKTGKKQAQQIDAPVGQVIVRAICSLASHGQTLEEVTQADDGCLIEATLPSDIFALAGKLLVEIHRDGSQTTVSAATNIGGQVYDWGKSNRCLKRLFADLTREAA